jgi:hypothetical protein
MDVVDVPLPFVLTAEGLGARGESKQAGEGTFLLG